MKNLVSIIIPAYNSEKWIGSCIKSAITQTYNPKEIIVVDDASTDATFKVAKAYSSSNIKVVKNDENCGASATRNHGLRLSQGDYIQWLDADDYLDSHKIERQMKLANKIYDLSVLFSGSWGHFISAASSNSFRPDLLWDDLDPYEWLLRKIENNLWMPPMVFLVSRALTEKAGLWNEKLKRDNDGEYFCRVISNASEIKFVLRAKSYKRSTLGISHQLNLNNQKLESIAFSLKSYIHTLLAIKNNDRVRNASLGLLNRWSIYFYPERKDIFSELQDIADSLGGCLEIPTLRPKYRWMQPILGFKLAKKLQFGLPSLKSSAQIRYEALKQKFWINEK